MAKILGTPGIRQFLPRSSKLLLPLLMPSIGSSLRPCLQPTGSNKSLGNGARHYQIQTKKVNVVNVYKSVPSLIGKGTNAVNLIWDQLYEKYDADGWRRKLLDKSSPGSIRPGDVIRVRKADRSYFIGMAIAIKRNALSSNLLIRNKVGGLGVEVRYNIFNPNIESIEIVRRPIKRKRRAKLYYVRGSSKHDVGDLDTEVSHSRRR